MPIYLTSNSFPELSNTPMADRRRLLKRCAPMTFRHWQTWAALCAGTGCVALCAYLGWEYFGDSWAGGWIGAFLGAAIAGGILGQVKGTLVRPYLRAELQRQVAPRENV